eukprot:2563718-Amphidinium_carterae.1
MASESSHWNRQGKLWQQLLARGVKSGKYMASKKWLDNNRNAILSSTGVQLGFRASELSYTFLLAC